MPLNKLGGLAFLSGGALRITPEKDNAALLVGVSKKECGAVNKALRKIIFGHLKRERDDIKFLGQ